MRSLRKFLASLRKGFGIFGALRPLVGVWHSIWNAGILRFFTRFFLLIIWAFWATIRWGTSLQWRLLLQGAPALLIAGTIVTFTIMALYVRPHELQARYKRYARTAHEEKRFDDELADLERLAQLQNDDKEVMYDTAVAALWCKQPDRCRLLMRQLAPLDKPGGYAKAHVWNASDLFTSSRDHEARLQAKAHLTAALALGVQDKEGAHWLFGEICNLEGEFPEAVQHLTIAVKTKPNARLSLAHAYAMQGKLEEAKAEAKKAADWNKDFAQADMTAIEARLAWAHATAYMDDYPAAKAILEEGWANTKEDRYRLALAEVYRKWFVYLSIKGNSNPAERLAKLQIGLQYNPSNLGLLQGILYATGINSKRVDRPTEIASAVASLAAMDGPQFAYGIVSRQRWEVIESRKVLRELLVNDIKSPILQFIVGMDDFENGRLGAAKDHWEQAYKLTPKMPMLANNLAFLLYQTDPDQLPRALDLVNTAVKEAPNDPNIRDTRGRILAKMAAKIPVQQKQERTDKFKEARSDLEAARVGLATMPRSPETVAEMKALHVLLAEVYTELGDTEMADTHKRLAESLRKDEN